MDSSISVSRQLSRALQVAFLVTVGAVVLIGSSAIPLPAAIDSLLGARIQTFVTIFLGIFIEAVPFLLAGSIVSGIIEVFVDKDTLYNFVPRHAVPASVAGAGLGLIFPVCECGVVPVTRRLYQKGLPLSMGIAFLLAAPVVNPVVIVSTFAAFGWGPVLWGRIGLSILVAFAVGLIFWLAHPDEMLLPEALETQDHAHHCHTGDSRNRLWQSLTIAGDDFMDMGRYLVAGSLLAAGMQTLVSQPALLSIGQDALTSVLAMQGLAFVLSVCSTVDAFLALAFANTFTTGSILAFLTFGPMVDIKSSLMFLSVFKRKIVLYLILLPLLMTMLTGVYLNLNVGI